MSTTIKLSSPVGKLSQTKKRGNLPNEVKTIKGTLQKLGIYTGVSIDETVNDLFVKSIRTFQSLYMAQPDGRIDPGGGTLRRINELAGGKAIVVNLNRQILNAFSKLSQTYNFDCASGDVNHRTPPGYYRIYRKHKTYRSKTYDAQMDYAMFFHRGYAIHMAHIVGVTSFLKWSGFDSLGSHGCVRLAESDAQKLFGWAPMQTPVVVLPRN